MKTSAEEMNDGTSFRQAIKIVQCLIMLSDDSSQIQRQYYCKTDT
jgi:hypothetical protein